jgi:hypothetical protein
VPPCAWCVREVNTLQVWWGKGQLSASCMMIQVMGAAAVPLAQRGKGRALQLGERDQ